MVFPTNEKLTKPSHKPLAQKTGASFFHGHRDEGRLPLRPSSFAPCANGLNSAAVKLDHVLTPLIVTMRNVEDQRISKSHFRFSRGGFTSD
jgi:hypothetical protein